TCLSQSLPAHRHLHFPYTTLFRSTPTVCCPAAPRRRLRAICRRKRPSARPRARPTAFGRAAVRPHARPKALPPPPPPRPPPSKRSEEHTSELQSRFDLVCRLLLEK